MEVNVTDDVLDLELSKESLRFDEGASGSFTVRLKAQPSNAVTVAVTARRVNSDRPTNVTVDKDTLTFTASNWNMPQTVTVSAPYALGGHAVAIDLGASDGQVSVSKSVSVVVFNRVGLGMNYQSTLREGGRHYLTLFLSGNAPSADVTVSLVAGHPLKFSPTKLTFTPENWNMSRWVNVSVAEDADARDEIVSFSAITSGAEYDGLSTSYSLRIDDTDNPTLSVSAASVMVVEGDTATFTVKLGVQPSGGDVTVDAGNRSARRIPMWSLTLIRASAGTKTR